MALAPQPIAAQGMPLHATWWSVLRPGLVVDPVSGQPGYEPVHVCETIAEATAHVAAIAGGVIVMHCAVFVNPKASPVLRARQ